MASIRTICFLNRLLLLLAWAGLGGLSLQAQLETSDPVKRKWYDGAVRLVKGGDNHYYLIRNANGQYWSFGRSGLYRFEVLRFGPDLQLKDVQRIGRREGTSITNAFEVLPAPEGIAFVDIAPREEDSHHDLRLSILSYQDKQAVWENRNLARLKGFTPRVSNPDIRLAFSPDSSFVLLTWRESPNRDANDNATVALVLDRELNLLHTRFEPFRKALLEFRLLRIGIADADHLFFWVRAFRYTGVFAASQGTSFHLLEYQVSRKKLREIRLNNMGDVMMDARLSFAPDQSVQVAGWWLNGVKEKREMGVYIGDVGTADTLAHLVKAPFLGAMRHAMLPKVQADGDAWYRPNYQSELLRQSDGFLYALHLHGRLEGNTPVNVPGNRYDNVLVVFSLDAAGKLHGRYLHGWCNEARTDYYETYSWLPVETDRGWAALVSDFSGIPTFSRSHMARSLLISLEDNQRARTLETGMNAGGNWVLAPRIFIREEPQTIVFLAKSRKYYRLIRMRF